MSAAETTSAVLSCVAQQPNLWRKNLDRRSAAGLWKGCIPRVSQRDNVNRTVQQHVAMSQSLCRGALQLRADVLAKGKFLESRPRHHVLKNQQSLVLKLTE